MKDFAIRLVSVLFAIPSMLLINLAIEYLSGGFAPYTGEGVDYSGSIYAGLLFVGFYSLPVYLFLGIPVSYLVDYISKKLKPNSLAYSYVDKLILYGVVCVIMLSLFVRKEDLFSVGPYMLIVIPVLTYFHVLYFLKKYNK
ncbi:MAG: hypothetical protein ACQEV0_09265 [Bacillota bacterium]